jgi:crossover junction endodeoxyribonuclease RuvC
LIILGIDPGLHSGAVAIVRDDGTAAFADMPTLGDGTTLEVNALVLAGLIRSWKPDHCYIERAQYFPQQGGSSAFKYGGSYFAVRAVVALCHVPITAVMPGVWKKHYGLKGGKGKDLAIAKEKARQRATQLYPALAAGMARKMDHGRAESLLIARFGALALATSPGPRAMSSPNAPLQTKLRLAATDPA